MQLFQRNQTLRAFRAKQVEQVNHLYYIIIRDHSIIDIDTIYPRTSAKTIPKPLVTPFIRGSLETMSPHPNPNFYRSSWIRVF